MQKIRAEGLPVGDGAEAATETPEAAPALPEAAPALPEAAPAPQIPLQGEAPALANVPA